MFIHVLPKALCNINVKSGTPGVQRQNTIRRLSWHRSTPDGPLPELSRKTRTDDAKNKINRIFCPRCTSPSYNNEETSPDVLISSDKLKVELIIIQ